jgi:molybdenum cofactor synthesis domain-containing protein
MGTPPLVRTAVVITVSDEVADGRDTDRGGPVAAAILEEYGLPTTNRIVPDAPAAITAAVTDAIESAARVVVASGGTGIGPNDFTSETIAGLVDYQIPGIAEEIRRRGSEQTLVALVSREVVGVILPKHQQTPHEAHQNRIPRPVLVMAIPGSRGGVRDALGVVTSLLDHILSQLDGAGHHI